MQKLAELYRDEGRYSEAETLYIRLLDSRRQALGNEHPFTLSSLASVGRVALLRKKHAAAETTLRDALKAYKEAASDTWGRYNCESLLGESLASQKKFAEAEPLLLSGYNGLVQRLALTRAEDRVDLVDAGHRIVKLYQDWGKADKATEWQQKLRDPSPK
jgi:tetratricopeptide (TPR) repeat protein